MPVPRLAAPARGAVPALAALAVLDVLYAIVALAAYERRIGVVTHDGSGTVEMIDSLLGLDELRTATAWLVLLALLVAVATTANWAVRLRRAGLPTAPTAPVTGWWISTVLAVPANIGAALWYRSATAQGGEYMRTVEATSNLLVVAACAAVVTAAVLGIRVVRRTEVDRLLTAADDALTAGEAQPPTRAGS
ncbi:hypothetical protein ABNF97_01015 [Plantactinospora sp. B6F1]|uniref:hypothetical protein n=1 Tax=Plantactinospora sp. B6F1 TaxID=3158971 RepID=UPI00102B3062